jgi:hypothetical protein
MRVKQQRGGNEMPVFHVTNGPGNQCDLEIGMYPSDFFELRTKGAQANTLQVEFVGSIPAWLAVDVGNINNPNPGWIQSVAQQGEYVISLRRNANPGGNPNNKFTIHFDGQSLDPRIIPR